MTGINLVKKKLLKVNLHYSLIQKRAAKDGRIQIQYVQVLVQIKKECHFYQ